MELVTRIALVAGICISLTHIASASEPRINKIDLFEANHGGYAHYRIPGIVVTKKGTLLAYCEARKDARGDWGTIDILLRRSEDGGKTWTPPRVLVQPPDDVKPNPVAVAQDLGGENQVTMNNPVAIVDRQPNVVHFLYCVEYARCFYMRSNNDGKSWTKPVEITSAFEALRDQYDWKVLATGPGHGIQLAGGRLLVPVWLSTGTGGHAHRPSVVSTIYSDDSGDTWQVGEIVVAHPHPKNPSETVPVQLADGRVMLNIRHESRPHGRGVSISNDGSTNWSPMKYDDALPEPICMASIIRHSMDPPRILFVNPHNESDTQRKNVTVKLSEDDGTTWTHQRSLEPGVSGYSDVAVGPDGSIYCYYERGTASDTHYNPAALTLAKFNLAWVMQK